MGKSKRGINIMRIKFASQKGAAMVEFALILILLFILTFGLIEFGLLMYNQQVITNATREGARLGIVQRSPSRITIAEIETEVRKYAATHLVTFESTSPNVNVSTANFRVIAGTTDCQTSSTGGVCVAFGDCLTVTATYTYTFLVVDNFIPGLGNTKTLSSQAVMKCE
jgi:Flp pilus assembly protein TadG